MGLEQANKQIKQTAQVKRATQIKVELKYERNVVGSILFGDHKYSVHEYNTKRTQIRYEEKTNKI